MNTLLVLLIRLLVFDVTISKSTINRYSALNDRDVDMDHLCFPHLFCNGRG